MDDKINDLKKSIDEVEVPQELDNVINKAIKRGKRDMTKKNYKFKVIKAAACAAIVLATAFTAGINTIPAFAESLKDIPGVAGIVKVLQFEKGSGTGGELTDGQDIKNIDWDKKEEGEAITIEIFAEDAPAIVPGNFEVTHQEYPYSLLLTLNGVRSLSMSDFVTSEDSELLDSVYRIITLDDSMQRFVITFKTAVEVEVAELQDPAGIYIEFKEDKTLESLPPIYSLRSASFDFGEPVGVIEERLRWEYDGNSVRMLQDREGKFFVEEGYYFTEEEAMARQEEIKELEYVDFELYIEKRGGTDIPGNIE